MTAKVYKDFTFLSSVHFEGKFMVNLYELSASMSVITEDVREQNIAIERMNYFLGSHIEDCIFVNEKETEAIEKYNNAGIKVALTPEDPYDQIVGLILLNKCNAIMEDRMVVNSILFGSKLSNLIKFQISDEEAAAEYPGKHWWNSAALTMQNKKKKDKIVSLFEKDNWVELDLTWKEK